MEPDRKAVHRAARQKINAGMAKQQAYEELAKEFLNRNTVAEVVRYVPTVELKNKYDYLNIICLVILGLVGAVKVVSISVMGMIWIGLMIHVVAVRQYRSYWALVLLGVLSLLGSLGTFFTNDSRNQLMIVALAIDGTISALFLFFGIMIPKLMAPPYEEKKELFTNSAGQKKIRVIHIFLSETKESKTLDDVF